MRLHGLKKTVVTVAMMLLGVTQAGAQQTPPAEKSDTIIRTDTKLVLVDTVVADKKGNYIRNLTAKNFRVWEDNKEQQISSFSFEADPAAPVRDHYIVLFFDNANMNLSDQGRARQAATNFIQGNAGPNRLMAVVNYGGALQVAQNFTGDADRLTAVVSKVKIPFASASGGGQTSLQLAGMEFASRDVILALRALAKNLSTIPGRKTLVFLSGGFLVTPDMLSEVTATIDACNRANVAIYPIDVRGLVSGGPGIASLPMPPQVAPFGIVNRPASASPFLQAAYLQRGGGVGGGSRGGGAPVSAPPSAGGRTGIGTGTTSTGTGIGNVPRTGTFGNNPMYNPQVQPRPSIIPPFPSNSSTNQQVLYMLANGTGGFVIVNTNDLIGGLERIGKEQNEFYLIGYTPPDTADGSCHTLKVKVDAGGAVVRSRSGYCSAKPHDMLAKTPVEAQLETRAASTEPGNVGVAIQLPFFYTGANTARVNVAMEIATGNLKFEKQKDKFHTAINVLGIAHNTDGSVAARFSDKVNLDLDTKKDVEAFQSKPYHYENQFDIASGKYSLVVAFDAGGENFGRVESPLTIDPYDPKKFMISSLAFSTHVRPAAQADTGIEAELIEDRVPLISNGMRVIPSGTATFAKTDKVALYIEVYEPLLAAEEVPKDLAVALQMRILDGASKAEKWDSKMFRYPLPPKAGSPVIPVGTELSLGALDPGSYLLEVTAMDSTQQGLKRFVKFNVK